MSKEIDIEYYHQLALQKQKEHRKVLANLKKKPPKNLDKIAQQIHEEVFAEIDCTACANCCKTLGPDFKEADITRIAIQVLQILKSIPKATCRHQTIKWNSGFQ